MLNGSLQRAKHCERCTVLCIQCMQATENSGMLVKQSGIPAQDMATQCCQHNCTECLMAPSWIYHADIGHDSNHEAARPHGTAALKMKLRGQC